MEQRVGERTKTKNRIRLAFAVLMLPLAAVGYAAEYNFYDQADKKVCASIITERGQDECARTQRAKDDACRVPVHCEVDKQERLISTYKEAKERLDPGQVADADKEKLQETVRVLKDQLDRSETAASEGTSIAQGCVRAREDAQK